MIGIVLQSTTKFETTNLIEWKARNRRSEMNTWKEQSHWHSCGTGMNINEGAAHTFQNILTKMTLRTFAFFTDDILPKTYNFGHYGEKQRRTV